MIVVAHQITNSLKIAITADFVPNEAVVQFLQRIANENKFHYNGTTTLLERQTGRILSGSEIMVDSRDYQLVGLLMFDRV